MLVFCMRRYKPKYIHYMTQAYVKTIIWAEFYILSKSMLKWDVTDFWQIFEDVQICMFETSFGSL